MDFIPFILLVLAAFAVGIRNTDIDENYTDDTGTDQRETHLDRCTNLTEKELPASLYTLALKGCSMKSLAAIDFGAVANLSVLQLRYGSIWLLKREHLAKLPHLQILELAYNFIDDVSFDAFVGLSRLRVLTLNQNKLELLNGSVFQSLPELRHLDLSDNSMIALATMLFAGNPKLEVLLLRGNPFRVLWIETFRALNKLILLDLRSSGRCTDLELYSAKTIRLDNGQLSRLEVMGEVSTLQARSNKLEHVRLEVKDHVTELDLHGNSLETYDIAELLRGMWSLQLLDLSHNLVTELPVFKPRLLGEVVLLPNLRFVNLSQNRLEHVHKDSPLLSPSLTHLDVSYNQILGIEAHTFGMVENLQYLYLQGNLISQFMPDRFYNKHRGLKEVSFYDNPIGYVRFCRITKYFEEAGVHVLEKNPLSSHCDYSEQDPVKNHNHTDRNHFQSKAPLWSTFSVLILLGLLASLILDVFLFLQLRRTRAQGLRGKAKFVCTEGSEIII